MACEDCEMKDGEIENLKADLKEAKDEVEDLNKYIDKVKGFIDNAIYELEKA